MSVERMLFFLELTEITQSIRKIVVCFHSEQDSQSIKSQID